jgi:hypothetical protein
MLSILGALVLLAFGTALGDLLSEELRGWLDRVPYGLLRLAARRLPEKLRDDQLIGWVGELHEFLRGAEARPIVRLLRGTKFAVGLLWSAGSIARALGSAATPLKWFRVPLFGGRGFFVLLGIELAGFALSIGSQQLGFSVGAWLFGAIGISACAWGISIAIRHLMINRASRIRSLSAVTDLPNPE